MSMERCRRLDSAALECRKKVPAAETHLYVCTHIANESKFRVYVHFSVCPLYVSSRFEFLGG